MRSGRGSGDEPSRHRREGHRGSATGHRAQAAHDETRTVTRAKAALQTVVLGAFLAAALFVPAGRASWPMAWAVLAVYAAFSIAGLLLLPEELIAERSRRPPDARRGDLVLAGLALFFLLPATLVMCGLDARFRGSPAFPAAIRVLALAVFALGYALSLWAARSNPFFSAVVRVQRERGHRVVTTGPYAFVRHPGYAGPLVGHLALPLALGSFWGLVPALIGCVFLVLRIGDEERTLARDLAGYREYARRVRWRLVPGLW
jgi:protein-S-isoprenylcysteine O-methyltransferase Ste14